MYKRQGLDKLSLNNLISDNTYMKDYLCYQMMAYICLLYTSFRNMVYIGDSSTDIPCMKLVNSYGGHSIGVYDPASANKQAVYQMIRENRIRYFVPADYTAKSPMDTLIKTIINKTAAYERLEEISINNQKEAINSL